jgi:hypothetical protein
MQITDLYTVQPTGIDDTSLETNELGAIDSDGAQAFERVLNGDLSEGAKGELASFLAAQIMRDPDTLSNYRLKVQDYALQILDAINAPDYATFSSELSSRVPGAEIREDEFNHVRALGKSAAEQAIERIVTGLEAAGGMPELPFTDLIRNSSGRDILRNALLSLNWELRTDQLDGFLLGDKAILFDKGSLADGLRTPLSRAQALYLTPTADPSRGIASNPAKLFDVDGLNQESAARARRWLVGEKAKLNTVKSQVGANSFHPV